MAGMMDYKLAKCKTCGEPLNLAIAQNGVVVCGVCGYSTILPKENASDKVRELLSHGDSFLDTAKFEDAYTMFSKASEEDGEEPEAYFGMALAEYRVQYVKDLKKDENMRKKGSSEEATPSNSRLQAIVHSVSRDNFCDNINYRRALQYATDAQKRVYEERARDIDYIRDQFYRLKNSGLKYDCFICVKVSDPNNPGKFTQDSVVADEICTYLKRKGFKPFYSEQVLQDVAGCDYEAHILYALYTAECLLLVCYDESYLRTKWVRNEYMRFLKLVNDDEKESDSITVVYGDRPIEKLPGKNGKIQGIRGKSGDRNEQVYRFVEKHTPEARQRKEEEERAKKEAEDRRVADLIEQKMRQSSINAGSQPSTPIKPLLMRASQELSMNRLDKANEYYNKVLDIQPECAEAWFGMMMLEFDCKSESELLDKIDKAYVLDESKNKLLFNVINSQYGAQVKKYADSALLARYNKIIESCNKTEGWFRMMLQEMECRSDKELLDKIKRSYSCDKKKTEFLNKFRNSKYGERVRTCATGDLRLRYDALWRASNDADSWYKVWLLEFGCANDRDAVLALRDACCLDEKRNGLLFKFKESEYGRAVASCASGELRNRYDGLMRECNENIERLRQGALSELNKVQNERTAVSNKRNQLIMSKKDSEYIVERGQQRCTIWWLRILVLLLGLAGCAALWFFALGFVIKCSPLSLLIQSGEKFNYLDIFKLDKVFGGEKISIKDLKDLGIPAFTGWGMTIIKGKATLGFVIQILAYSAVSVVVLCIVKSVFRGGWGYVGRGITVFIILTVLFSVAWFFIFARYWMAHFDIGNNYLKIFNLKLSNDNKYGLLKMSELAQYGVTKFGGWGLTIGPGVLVQPIVCGAVTSIAMTIILRIVCAIKFRSDRKNTLLYRAKYNRASRILEDIKNSESTMKRYDSRISQMQRIINKTNASLSAR